VIVANGAARDAQRLGRVVAVGEGGGDVVGLEVDDAVAVRVWDDGARGDADLGLERALVFDVVATVAKQIQRRRVRIGERHVALGNVRREINVRLSFDQSYRRTTKRGGPAHWDKEERDRPRRCPADRWASTRPSLTRVS